MGGRNLCSRVIASLIPTITVVGNISTTSTSCQTNPDFFQIIDYAMNRVNGGASNPQKTFQVGAALIDQYDVEDLYDEDPNLPSGSPGNTITIIDSVGNGNPADYVYGIEGMSYDDPISEFGPTAVRAVSAACAGKLRASQPPF